MNYRIFILSTKVPSTPIQESVSLGTVRNTYLFQHRSRKKASQSFKMYFFYCLFSIGSSTNLRSTSRNSVPADKGGLASTATGLVPGAPGTIITNTLATAVLALSVGTVPVPIPMPVSPTRIILACSTTDRWVRWWFIWLGCRWRIRLRCGLVRC